MNTESNRDMSFSDTLSLDKEFENNADLNGSIITDINLRKKPRNNSSELSNDVCARRHFEKAYDILKSKIQKQNRREKNSFMREENEIYSNRKSY